MTTRANNQFPWPDFHRLDKQPYRLRTKDTKVSEILFLNFVLFVSFVVKSVFTSWLRLRRPYPQWVNPSAPELR